MTDDYFGLALRLSQQAAARLSEKDVAAIRDTADAENCICKTCTKRIKALLADRDAHLADLKEARELIVESKSFSYCSGMAPSRRCGHCKRVDALLERTK